MYLEASDYWLMALLVMLVVAALAMYFLKNLMHAAIVFGAYSMTMVLVWLTMNTPDLAITEAAAGICMTVMIMVVIMRTDPNRKVRKK
ncbi:MAG TPA: hydrogenase subunit MbhD domain-containing protein [Clostridia bacterium]